MDKKGIRYGNWICDISNYNYELRAGLSEMQYAHIFEPIFLSRRFLKMFKVEVIGGKEMFFKEEGLTLVSLENLSDKWRLSIHTENMKVEGKIKYVHELQNLLFDCGIRWDI